MKSAGRPMQRRLIGADGPSLDALLDRKVAVAVLSHVDYRTGALLDIAAITRRLHDAGALVIWDLCHSAGVMEIGFDLHAVDFAVGCTYKYLNGGPGSPAFIAVAKAHQAAAQHPLSGWWGHAAPFAFDRDFRPDPGHQAISLRDPADHFPARRGRRARRHGTAREVSALRQKSLALTELFMARVAELLPGLEIVTPRAASVARQPGRDRFRQGLSGDSGDDRTRRDRRFSRARYHAVWFCTALRPVPGRLGRRRNTRRLHRQGSLARSPLQQGSRRYLRRYRVAIWLLPVNGGTRCCNSAAFRRRVSRNQTSTNAQNAITATQPDRTILISSPSACLSHLRICPPGGITSMIVSTCWLAGYNLFIDPVRHGNPIA